MSIATGQYTIVNVRQSNLAYLADPNDGTPVAASYEQNNTKERVSLPIKNVDQNMFAVAGNCAGEGSVVEAFSSGSFRRPASKDSSRKWLVELR
jgi:hypothetical protein